MASQEDLAGDGTYSSSQVLQATPQDASEDPSEDLKCPICLGTINDEAHLGFCGHTFCFPCILQCSRTRDVCPICRQTFYYIYHKVGASNYEVHNVGQHNSSARRARGRRSRPRSARRRQRHSPGRHHRSFSSTDHSGDHARAPERGQSRSPRRHRNGHSRDRHGQGYDPSSSTKRQRRSAQDSARNSEHQAPRPEQDIPASMGRSERRQRGGRASCRERRATRSRSRWRSRSPAGRRAW